MGLTNSRILEYQKLCEQTINHCIDLEQARVEALQLIRIVAILHNERSL